MKIVIDSNILFSALIKDSTTRRLILEYGGTFLFPEYIFTELEKYKEGLLTKSKMYETEFEKLLVLLLKKVVIIPNERALPYKEEALTLVKDVDINDILFVACVLAHPDSLLWSDDKALKKIKGILVLHTQEIIEFMKEPTFEN
ncbi:TPA: PIN domain-containing protein [Candidatus Woesearchaeota archaeon]|nr:PIN domain-containing protein [Candidatus Woesearchaeota archaeon]HIH47731.1 PIN domain-containing protein [Candidatus Woesearchaeota archaeon]HII88742.1 PIN domain-containing protein [Candidatus Woesearchaeota archaeon]